MNVEINDLIKVVDELNELLPEGTVHYFGLVYASYWTAITFGEIQLWCSENDDREFNEDENDWEPLLPYLKKQFCKIGNEVLMLNKLINA